eukprot:6393720-Amphidinium_carterae.2
MRGVMDSQLKSFQETLAARGVQSWISDDAWRQECSEFQSELEFSAGRAARVEIEAAQANTLARQFREVETQSQQGVVRAKRCKQYERDTERVREQLEEGRRQVELRGEYDQERVLTTIMTTRSPREECVAMLRRMDR